MNKKIIFIFAISFCICFVQTSSVSAAKVIFPNGSKLQPIPVYASPAISENVNSSLGQSYENPTVSGVSATTVPSGTVQSDTISQQSPSQDNSSSVSIFFWPVVYSTIVVLVIIIGIVFFWLL